MLFPAFVLFLCGTVLLFAAACAVYGRLYKRRPARRRLPPPFPAAAVLGALFLLAAVPLGFALGLRLADRGADAQIDVHAFYAEVESVGTETLAVQGLAINSAEDRGARTLRLYEGLPVERDGAPIPLSELKAGDLVSVVLLTDTGGTEEIFKIELLEGAGDPSCGAPV